jgi:uncharacterized coiled-coil protein SlyX
MTIDSRDEVERDEKFREVERKLAALQSTLATQDARLSRISHDLAECMAKLNDLGQRAAG